MTPRLIAGFFLISLALLLAASSIGQFSLWSRLGNATVPWFCTSLALAVLIVGVTCLLLERPPSAIPVRHSVFVTIVVSVLLGIGLVLDGIAYGTLPDRLATVGEWLGFVAILAGAFWLPRLRTSESGTR